MSSGGLRGENLSNYHKCKCGVVRLNTLQTPPLLIHDVSLRYYSFFGCLIIVLNSLVLSFSKIKAPLYQTLRIAQ